MMMLFDEGEKDYGPANMLRPVLGLFYDTPGAANYRKCIHDEIQLHKNRDVHDIIEKAKKCVCVDVLNERS